MLDEYGYFLATTGSTTCWPRRTSVNWKRNSELRSKRSRGWGCTPRIWTAITVRTSSGRTSSTWSSAWRANMGWPCGQGRPTSSGACWSKACRPPSTVSWIRGRIPPKDKADVLAAILRELPAGLSEWALHPGIATDELRAVMARSQSSRGDGDARGPSVGLRRGCFEEAARNRGGGRHPGHRLPRVAAGLASGELGIQRPCSASNDGGQWVAGFVNPVDDALGEGCAGGGMRSGRR